MLSHVTIGSNDLPRAIEFYDALLATLGVVRYETDLEHGLAGYAFAPERTRSSGCSARSMVPLPRWATVSPWHSRPRIGVSSMHSTLPD